MMIQATHRVLVIDDDGNLRQLLKLLFEHHGYEILLAPDGEIGMTLAEGGRPDVILLDVAMPYRSGIEVYLDLQNNPLTSNIPIREVTRNVDEQTAIGKNSQSPFCARGCEISARQHTAARSSRTTPRRRTRSHSSHAGHRTVAAPSRSPRFP